MSKQERIILGTEEGEYKRGLRQLLAWKYRPDRPKNRGKRDTASSARHTNVKGEVWEIRGSGFYARRSA